MGKYIGTKPDEVSISWVDCWSFGHLLFGAIAYFIIYAIVYFGFYNEFPNWFATNLDPQMVARYWGLGGAIICGIVWEPIENIGLLKLGLKEKRDSWPNLIIDTIMVAIGATILFFVHVLWINLVLCIALLVLLIVTHYLTFRNSSSP